MNTEIWRYNDEVLMHHGIKGQKWGVRRGPPYPIGSKSGPIVLKKGTKVQRISSKAEESNNKGHAYVSQLSSDNNAYLVEMGKDAYKIDLEVTNDIIIPMYKESMDAALKAIMQADKKHVVSDVKKRADKEEGERFVKELENRKITELSDEAYRLFSTSLIDSSYNRKIFFDELKKRGYNAVIDEHDHQYMNRPIIVFERDKNLKRISSQKVTDDMQKEAEKHLAGRYKRAYEKATRK